MQSDALKYTLLDKLISIDDNALLEKVNELIGNVDIERNIIKVSKGQRETLSNSEDDILQGNIISDEDLNNEEDQWLKE